LYVISHVICINLVNSFFKSKIGSLNDPKQLVSCSRLCKHDIMQDCHRRFQGYSDVSRQNSNKTSSFDDDDDGDGDGDDDKENDAEESEADQVAVL
jgi:hypothetical protein